MTTVDCYGDYFEEHVMDVLREEGSLTRRRLFEEFIEGRIFVCNRCDREFEAKTGVEEDDEVLCRKCPKRD